MPRKAEVIATREEIGAAWTAVGGYEDKPYSVPRLKPRPDWFDEHSLTSIAAMADDHERYLKHEWLMLTREQRAERHLPVERFGMKTHRLIAEGIAIGIRVGIEIGRARANKQTGVRR